MNTSMGDGYLRSMGRPVMTGLPVPASDYHAPPVISVDDLPHMMAFSGQTQMAGWQHSFFDGAKFAGGFGDTQVWHMDYWTLRARSSQLFTENLYARGLIRRLITNEINIGLAPESTPDEKVLGLPEDALVEWADATESRFMLWGRDPMVCDWKQQSTFGAIQRAARLEALVAGDVLVVLRQQPGVSTPMVQLVAGDKVRTPMAGRSTLRKGHKITHGVETDPRGRIVAYWVRQDDSLEIKRLPAFGPRSGRRMAWLVYGTDKRLDDVRGVPLLSLVLQSLKEIDRYRDSAQRKAVINSMLALFIKKGEDKPSSLVATGGAKRKDTAVVTDGDGSTRTRGFIEQVPGVVLEELAQGEEPVGFDSRGVDVSFGPFEEAMIQAIAWANEVPPEILRLAFSRNYAGSQAAINEFKSYLNKVWSDWGETFCTPIWIDWMISETLMGRVDAPEFLTAWRTGAADIFGARVAVDWYGAVKPSADVVKSAKGSELLIGMGLTTRTREARTNTGSSFQKNVQRLKRENQLLAEAQRPIFELAAEFRVSPADVGGRGAPGAMDEDGVQEIVAGYLEDHGVADGE